MLTESQENVAERRAEYAYVPAPVKADRRPLYTRTIEAVTRLIAGGRYRSGDMLPKEFDLAKQLGVSRSTLRVAFSYTCFLTGVFHFYLIRRVMVRP